MNYRSFQTWVVTIFQVELGATALVLLLASCGGGHNPGDTYPASPPPSPAAVSGPDSFLLFPNPQSNPAINSPTYAQAYYYAIDPNNDKDTLAKWKAANHFGDPNPAAGSAVSAVFGDVRDLGYGRYMYGRKNADGTLAFMVENYLVWTTANYAYSSLNLDAAVAKDPRWHVNTNAIEFSPGPNGGAPFAKYYSFDTTGARLLAANLDGRGNKSMPGICINCHGGRGDALLPATASAVMGQFPIFGNPASGIRGDVKGKLHFFEPDPNILDFSVLPGYTRADQQAAIKTLNQWVLCTYPLPSSASGVPIAFKEDMCRTVAATNEWQGGSADVVKAAYNNGHLPVAVSGVLVDGMPNATYSDTYVPDAWVTSGQSTLYTNVVKPACRGCHLLRGVAPQSNIDFSTFAGFQAYADRIKHHLLDRGNMPLSKILYERFWSTPSMYQTLDNFLQASNVLAGSAVSYTVLDASNNPLRPGRPIANAGPDRVIGTPSTSLSAAGSLYADTYTWSVASGVAGLSNTSGVLTTFTASVDGTYLVQLVASKGSVQSDPVLLKIVVNSTAWPGTISPVSGSPAISNPLPAAIHFADIKNVMQQINLSTGKASACTQCHTTQPLLNVLLIPPVLYTNIDRNGDGAIDSADDRAFYNEVRGRINFSDIEASALLRHPAGYNHSGGVRDGFGLASSAVGGVGTAADQFTPGDPVRSAYDMFLNWILNGAPY